MQQIYEGVDPHFILTSVFSNRGNRMRVLWDGVMPAPPPPLLAYGIAYWASSVRDSSPIVVGSMMISLATQLLSKHFLRAKDNIDFAVILGYICCATP